MILKKLVKNGLCKKQKVSYFRSQIHLSADHLQQIVLQPHCNKIYLNHTKQKIAPCVQEDLFCFQYLQLFELKSVNLRPLAFLTFDSPQQQLYMPKRNSDFIKLFLRDSPMSQHQKFMKIITVPQSHKIIPLISVSDENFVNNYIKSLEYVPAINHKYNFPLQNLEKITGNGKIQNSVSAQPEKQSQQLINSIRDFAKFSKESLIPYQQLQQRITIAKSETINEVRMRLNYLFKVLLKQRNKLVAVSLQFQANLQLSQAIIKAFAKCAIYPESSQEWRKLQAMQKLMRARQYKKKGLNEMAMASFQQVFKDQAAESKTRMQALKVLCSEGELQGDISILQPLMSLSKEKGEKQFQLYIKGSIEKIIQRLSPKQN